MQPQHDGSLEALAALGFSCRESVRTDASKAQRKRIGRRNAELVRLQRGQVANAPRTAPRPRGAGRPRRAASRSSARSGDSGDDGPGEPPPPPPHVRRFARAAGLAIRQVRWCDQCGELVVFAADDVQRRKADAAGFVPGWCPDCSGVAA